MRINFFALIMMSIVAAFVPSNGVAQVDISQNNVASAALSQASAPVAAEPIVYVVNFTADWCPNCKILDPALNEALSTIQTPDIKHVVFDLTNIARTQETFELVNGTILGGVYGDYVGLTGLVVMVAADSGETVDCATRVMDAQAIAISIRNAVSIVRDRPVGERSSDSILCPPTNRKIPVTTSL